MDIYNYPTEMDANVKMRALILERAETDVILQVELKELCKRSILHWINLFCYTKDPRKPLDTIPFIAYPFQMQYILDTELAIDEQYDILTEKSRDMGVSWCVLYVFMHKWLFESGSDFRVGSRKEDFVDKIGDMDTLLEKVRFNILRQPLWMLPKGFDTGKHLSFMKIVNPENGNSIIGESANEHFGSGGRRKAILMDEFAKWDASIAEAAWTATADVSNCRIPVSTPVGSGNKFAVLAAGTKEVIKKSTIHWTLHPEKSQGSYYMDGGIKVPIETSERAFSIWQAGFEVRSPWYDAESERRSPADLAQEVGIDYLRSGYPFFNMVALLKQRVWEEMERKHPHDAIPYGKFIRGIIINIDNKYEQRDVRDGWLRIFEEPKSGFQYTLSGDVSEGLAKGDESFLIVREKYTRNVVAASNGLYATDDFAEYMQRAGQWYNNADVAPENNNHGYSVCQDLKKMDCRLYYTQSEHGEKAGWSTTTKTRPEMLDQAEEEIRKIVCELRDPILIAQCKTFVKNPKTGKPEADGAFLDDGVIAFAIGSAVIKIKPMKNRKPDKETRQRQLVSEMTAPAMGFRRK